MIAGHDWGGLLVWIMARQYPGPHRGRDRREHARPAAAADAAGAAAPRRSSPTRRSTSSSSRTAASPSGCWHVGPSAHDDFVEMMFGAGTDDERRTRSRRDVLDVYKRRVPRRRARSTPPLEYYRNMDRNWELTAAIADRTIDVPCLMISAANDPVLTPAMTDGHGSARAEPREGRSSRTAGTGPSRNGPRRRPPRCSPTSTASPRWN